jgi:hypothetical protein
MLFQAHGIGVNLSEGPWQGLMDSAFAAVRQRYARSVLKLSISVEKSLDGEQRETYRCRAMTDVFGWQSFEVDSDGEDPELVLNQSAEKLLATLASILERS